jgi:DNA topoisomerase I
MRSLLLLLSLTLICGEALAEKPRPRTEQSPAAVAQKFCRVERFADSLPQLQARVSARLQQPRLDAETALAAIVRIMDTTYMRVGSQKYAAPKGGAREPSYGASSLLKEHVTVSGDSVRFQFRGKSGVQWDRSVTDPQLARTLQIFLEQPGSRLFVVPDARGQLRPITERRVQGLLAEYHAKPKDFRTLYANRLLEGELAKLGAPKSKSEAERNLSASIRVVARKLGHTPGICRAAYLNKSRLGQYTDGLR